MFAELNVATLTDELNELREWGCWPQHQAGEYTTRDNTAWVPKHRDHDKRRKEAADRAAKTKTFAKDAHAAKRCPILSDDSDSNFETSSSDGMFADAHLHARLNPPCSLKLTKVAPQIRRLVRPTTPAAAKLPKSSNDDAVSSCGSSTSDSSDGSNPAGLGQVIDNNDKGQYSAWAEHHDGPEQHTARALAEILALADGRDVFAATSSDDDGLGSPRRRPGCSRWQSGRPRQRLGVLVNCLAARHRPAPHPRFSCRDSAAALSALGLQVSRGRFPGMTCREQAAITNHMSSDNCINFTMTSTSLEGRCLHRRNSLWHRNWRRSPRRARRRPCTCSSPLPTTRASRVCRVKSC